jgi:hypothetical protein
MASSRGNIPLLVFNQSGKQVTVNEAIEQISALGIGGVKGYLIDSPPSSPTEGDCYVISPTPSGNWLNYPNHIAHYLNGFWECYSPFAGLYTLEINTGKFVYFNGSTWNYTN